MMYVQSLKLLDSLHARHERERGESIEPHDDAAFADGDLRTLLFDGHAAHGRAGYERNTKQLMPDTRAIPALEIVVLLRHP